MSSEITHAIVIGAGAAKLAAAGKLSADALRVLILEARDREGHREPGRHANVYGATNKDSRAASEILELCRAGALTKHNGLKSFS